MLRKKPLSSIYLVQYISHRADAVRYLLHKFQIKMLRYVGIYRYNDGIRINGTSTQWFCLCSISYNQYVREIASDVILAVCSVCVSHKEKFDTCTILVKRQVDIFNNYVTLERFRMHVWLHMHVRKRVLSWDITIYNVCAGFFNL